jgi:hypothetical protein
LEAHDFLAEKKARLMPEVIASFNGGRMIDADASGEESANNIFTNQYHTSHTNKAHHEQKRSASGKKPSACCRNTFRCGFIATG